MRVNVIIGGQLDEHLLIILYFVLHTESVSLFAIQIKYDDDDDAAKCCNYHIVLPSLIIIEVITMMIYLRLLSGRNTVKPLFV